MAKTPSTMLALGTPAPDFSLLEPATGKVLDLGEIRGKKGLVVIFMCNHCPFVKHIADAIGGFARDYQGKGIGIVGINSNDVSLLAGDSPEQMVEEVNNRGYSFPYLYDEHQDVAKAYRAACTPDFYFFDSRLQLVYRGQFDGSRPDNGVAVTGVDLVNAVEAVLSGEPVSHQQHASLGCNIKWQPGNEPDYFNQG